MAPVWLVVRAGLRARWRTWLVLAVLTGLAGGLLLSFLTLIAAALALAVAIAAIPGMSASRARPAEALRAE